MYRIVFKDYPPDLEWYETAENLGSELIPEYEARIAAEAEEEKRAAEEDAELDALEDEEALPPQ